MGFIEWFKSLFKKKELHPENSPPSSLDPTAPPMRPIDQVVVIPPVSVPGKKLVTRPKDLPKGNHYASRNRSLLEQEYEYLWPQAVVIPEFESGSKSLVKWFKEHRNNFDLASRATRVPAWVIAAITILEGGPNFDKTILNGDPWNQKTKHYPSGLGPWNNWLDACIWGLRYEAKGWNFDLTKYRWTVGSTFYFAEAYNGFNVREEMGKGTVPPYASSYLFSATQFYKSGKKVEKMIPGSSKTRLEFDPKLVSKQVGFMAFARALEDSGEALW